MAINQFLPFGTAVGSNVLDQTSYGALSARISGFSAGTASSAQFNKVFRQASVMTSMLGDFIRTIGGLDALDDGDINALLANFIASLDKRADTSRLGSFLTVTGSPSATPAVSPSDGDEFPVAASATGLWAGKDGQIARWVSATSSWAFSPCRLGRLVRIGSTDVFYQRISGGWSSYTFGTTVSPTVAWGAITGLLGNQTDLSAALSGKSDISHAHDGTYVKLSPSGGALQTVSGPLRVGGDLTVDVALKPAGAAGTSNQVLVSRGGAANQWASAIDLLTQADVLAKLGVRTAWGAYRNPALGASPTYTSRGLGCTITWQPAPAGAGPHINVLASVTFDVPMQNTGYAITGWSLGVQGGGGGTADRRSVDLYISSRSVAGFVIDITNPNTAHNILSAEFDLVIYP